MTIQQTIDIQTPEGLHARPASQLVQIAAQFQSEIELAAGHEWVSARSILGILRLGLRQGDQVEVRATGPDAAEAMAAVAALLGGSVTEGKAS